MKGTVGLDFNIHTIVPTIYVDLSRGAETQSNYLYGIEKVSNFRES